MPTNYGNNVNSANDFGIVGSSSDAIMQPEVTLFAHGKLPVRSVQSC